MGYIVNTVHCLPPVFYTHMFRIMCRFLHFPQARTVSHTAVNRWSGIGLKKVRVPWV